MNYRHAYHAGNPGDCLKHALLMQLLAALQEKAAPVFVLDTHAGDGAYDLREEAAMRTGEWQAGIGRLLDDPPAALCDYVALVLRLGLYPGSPLLLRSMLRPGDRMACCELYPDAYAKLRYRFAGDRQIGVHRRNAWEALSALLPPAERRGLVLIDPPYEAEDEFARLLDGLRRGYARFRNGVFAVWYPIKRLAQVRDWLAAIQASGIRDVLAAELCWRAPLNPDRLNGCGLLVVNSPYGFEKQAQPILSALLERLGERGHGESASLSRLVDE
jgi:23S rRNA (adenine2030-N6)-methyltransferase